MGPAKVHCRREEQKDRSIFLLFFFFFFAANDASEVDAFNYFDNVIKAENCCCLSILERSRRHNETLIHDYNFCSVKIPSVAKYGHKSTHKKPFFQFFSVRAEIEKVGKRSEVRETDLFEASHHTDTYPSKPTLPSARPSFLPSKIKEFFSPYKQLSVSPHFSLLPPRRTFFPVTPSSKVLRQRVSQKRTKKIPF